MSISRIVDILVIFFIFLNVLAFDFPIAGINLRYIIFALLLITVFLADPSSFFSKKNINLLSLVFILYGILFLYSLLYGNSIENIMLFIRPLLVLFTIPAFTYVFRKYGVPRYLNCFAMACVTLLIVFVYVFTRSLLDFSFAQGLNDEEGLIFVNIHQILPRVVIKTFVFVIPFSIYIMGKLKGIWLHVFFVFMILVCLLSQTLGIVITTIIIYFYTLKMRGKIKYLYLSLLMLIGVYFVFDSIFLEEMFASKEGSASIKSEQIRNLLKDLDFVSFFFGRGIGCVFSNFDSRFISEPIIEVVAVQIFQMGGVLFSFIILYVYLRPAFNTLWNNNIYIRIMSLCQIGIFIASMFNPYLWGGGTGLLFVAMIEACSSQANKVSNYNNF